MPVPSLRRRLLVLLLLVLSLAWALAAGLSFLDARHELDEVFDAQLAQSARVLLAQFSPEADDEEIETEELERPQHKYEQQIAFQIWHRDGRLLLRSASAPATPLSPLTEGYGDRQIQGQAWRVFSRWDADRRHYIQVGERRAVRDELAGHIAARLLLPLGLALPLLAGLVWFGVGRGLAPLRQVAEAVGRRAPRHLDRLDSSRAPAEVRPLLDALNALFAKLEAAFARERRFTADAAHELRTPLAALKTQAQVARRAQDAAERERALDNVLRGVDRATRLVEQLLALARLEHENAAWQWQPVELAGLAAAVLAELEPTAHAKGIGVSLAAPDSCVLPGDATALAILLRNLVDNAVRHTPAGGQVAVRVSCDPAQALLEVSDNGPGIPAAERDKVWERFYRGEGVEAEGSGLGLSIVRRIIELHGGTVELGEPAAGRGLRVSCRFPLRR
ncbi:MAG: ATP-binding protein [Pseudomonadota bacterium]|uniref:ATP-binding protein n=1 Tax=Thermithiobacillus tepidarius TaxID=929 RepID=UPI000410147E|nr:ATP-binding protein [Thermithiobacillus tepidarius]